MQRVHFRTWLIAPGALLRAARCYGIAAASSAALGLPMPVARS
jgi:hypothetical protein